MSTARLHTTLEQRRMMASCAAFLFSLALSQPSSAVAADSLSARIASVMAHQGFPTTSIDEVLVAFDAISTLDYRVRSEDKLILRVDAATKRILAVSLASNERTISYFRFQTPDGRSEFFDARGRSAARAMRRHPFDAVLDVQSYFGPRPPDMRMQTGVVWRAASGTPVVAPGDGTIRSVEQRAEGARVSIDHGNGYQTTYSVLTEFSHPPGRRIIAGELLGRTGSSGTANVGFLYEFLYNDRVYDPLRVLLPSARTLEGEALAAFQRERDQIEALPEIAYELFRER